MSLKEKLDQLRSKEENDLSIKLKEESRIKEFKDKERKQKKEIKQIMIEHNKSALVKYAIPILNTINSAYVGNAGKITKKVNENSGLASLKWNLHLDDTSSLWDEIDIRITKESNISIEDGDQEKINLGDINWKDKLGVKIFDYIVEGKTKRSKGLNKD